MADGMYVSMNGAAARAAQLDSVADNLANAQTNGFKASRPAFQTLLAEGGQGQLAYASTADTGLDLSPGATVVTGHFSDVVPEGGAFLGVAMEDGSMGFTRNGRLLADGQGRLSIAGRTVVGADGQPLLVPLGAPWSIDAQGTVLSMGQEVGRLGLFQLAGPVERRGNAVYAPTGEGRAVGIVAEVRTGELELSNASPLESAVEMISAQRNFETSMQAIQTYRRLDERANELGKVR